MLGTKHGFFGREENVLSHYAIHYIPGKPFLTEKKLLRLLWYNLKSFYSYICISLKFYFQFIEACVSVILESSHP